MFRKLISNLPFNPSLLGTVVFYADRMKQEESLRRLGFGFVALAMFVQVFAVLAPPEPTLAASDNDIIRGGFRTKEEAVQICRDNERDFSLILSTIDITCDNLQNSSIQTIRSTDYNGQLYSMGRHARGAVGKGNKPTDEHAIHYFGGTVYMRRLASFDTWSHSSYKALVGTTATGKTFMILFNCGNPVLVGRHTPPQPPQVVDNGTCEVVAVPPYISRGEKFTATIRVHNTGSTVWDPGTGYKLGSEDPRDNLNWGTNRVALPGAVSPGGVRDVTGTFTAPQSPGTYKFSWRMLQENVHWFGATCSKPVTVKLPPAPKKPPEPPKQPEPPKDVCPEIPGVQENEAACVPCEESTSSDDFESCLIVAKTARNDTQDIPDANNTTASAGDEITYTLSVTNTGNRALDNFVFEEVLSDVLEYADLQSYENARFSKEHKTLTWPKTTIDAGATEKKTFVVKIKDEIPQTPVSVSDPGSYDLTMTNVFRGVAINIKLPPGISKTTEQVVTTLPNTGPGTSLAIGFVITTMAAYFFARNRLIGKELDIIRSDFAQTGGV